MKALLAMLTVMMVPSAALAIEETATIDQEVTDFVGDLEAGRRDQAIGRVSGIFSLTGEPRLVTTPGNFVDLVLSCQSKHEDSKVGSYIRIFKFSWKCDDDTYEAWLGKDPKSTYVEVIDPADSARIAARKNRPVMDLAPAPIKPETPEERTARIDRENADRTAVLAALEVAFKENSFAGSSGRITDSSNFALGFRDMAQKVFITEMDGTGLQAAEQQLAWLTNNIGKSASVECSQKPLDTAGSSYQFFFTFCSVKSERPGHGFTAVLDTEDGVIRSIQFNYMNAKVFLKNAEYFKSLGVY